MKASIETYEQIKKDFSYLRSIYTSETISYAIKETLKDDRVKDIYVRLSWDFIRHSYHKQGLNLFNDLIETQYKQGLNDNHLNTVFIKAFKKVFKHEISKFEELKNK
jgi:hypothetical protein